MRRRDDRGEGIKERHILNCGNSTNPPGGSLSSAARSAMGQGPTKNPIVCLASDSRHWGLNTFE
jgi:hypothetical protein